MVERTRKKPSTLPCIVCGEKLKTVQGMEADDKVVNQPAHGLTFTAGGQYGCQVFDPMDGSTLEINICDDCMKKAAKKGRVIHNESANDYLSKKAVTMYWNGGDI